MASLRKRSALVCMAIVGGVSTGALLSASDGRAQTGADPGVGPTERGTVEERSMEPGPTMRSTTPRTDAAVADRERRVARERAGDHGRYRDHRHGETYVAGFGGVTFGGRASGLSGRGDALGTPIPDPDLSNSILYGMKIGYFHPGRLNWLGLEVEAFNMTPHYQQVGAQPGSHLRLTTLAFNAIARTKLACRDDRRDHRDSRDVNRRDGDYSVLEDNARCPVHLYAGAGLGVFFAETSNEFGRSTDNARAGLNALAGVKYFFNEHFSVFAEYKFNYVDLKFDQNQYAGVNSGPTAGLNGRHMINNVVGGLALHF
jgi:opacity protein-like surface antigen